VSFQPPTFFFASCLIPAVVRTATPTPLGRLAIGEQRKAGSVDSSVMSSISSPWRSRWKEGGEREEREAVSRRTITAGGSGRERGRTWEINGWVSSRTGTVCCWNTNSATLISQLQMNEEDSHSASTTEAHVNSSCIHKPGVRPYMNTFTSMSWNFRSTACTPNLSKTPTLLLVWGSTAEISPSLTPDTLTFLLNTFCLFLSPSEGVLDRTPENLYSCFMYHRALARVTSVGFDHSNIKLHPSPLTLMGSLRNIISLVPVEPSDFIPMSFSALNIRLPREKALPQRCFLREGRTPGLSTRCR